MGKGGGGVEEKAENTTEATEANTNDNIEKTGEQEEEKGEPDKRKEGEGLKKRKTNTTEATETKNNDNTEKTRGTGC